MSAIHKAWRRHHENVIRAWRGDTRNQRKVAAADWAQWALLDMLDMGLVRLTADFARRTGLVGFARVADALAAGWNCPLPKAWYV